MTTTLSPSVNNQTAFISYSLDCETLTWTMPMSVDCDCVELMSTDDVTI